MMCYCEVEGLLHHCYPHTGSTCVDGMFKLVSDVHVFYVVDTGST